MKYVCLGVWEGLVPIGNIHLTVLEQLQNIRMPPTTPVVVTTNVTDHDVLDANKIPDPPTMIIYAQVPDTWEPVGASTGVKR